MPLSAGAQFADAWQIQNLIKVSTNEASFKHFERVESVGKFNHKIIKEGSQDAKEGTVCNFLYCFELF